MKLNHVTNADVVAIAREVVEENPNFVYLPPQGFTFCRYVHEDARGTKSCGCLVSHVLNRLGVPLNVLEAYETNGAARLARGLGLSKEVGYFLEVLQDNQDAGFPWGACLRTALADNAIGEA